MSINLLIIETKRDLMLVLVPYLISQGYKVFIAEEEHSAKKVLSEKKIDVVLLSVVSLKRRALELLKWIKRKTNTEVILISRSDQLSFSIEGMKLGAFSELVLPLDLATLTDSIKKAWESKKEKSD